MIAVHQSLVGELVDLLFELHRLGHNNTRDSYLLKSVFCPARWRNNSILLGTLATVRKNPRELVDYSHDLTRRRGLVF